MAKITQEQMQTYADSFGKSANKIIEEFEAIASDYLRLDDQYNGDHKEGVTENFRNVENSLNSLVDFSETFIAGLEEKGEIARVISINAYAPDIKTTDIAEDANVAGAKGISEEDFN